MEFFKYKNRLQPGKGRLLVSEPYLPDPNFERTIILLCDHNQDGSFGFVLNKPSVTKIGDVMEDLAGFAAPLFVGGPVQQDTLHYIHRYAELPDSVQITHDTYWGGNFESLKAMVRENQVDPENLKFFLGYSGWSEGQLEEEMESDSWIVSDKFDAALLFETDPDLMWKRSLKSMGGRYSVYSNYPVDPRQN